MSGNWEFGILVDGEACDGNGGIVGVNYFGGSRKVQAEYVRVLASREVRREVPSSGNRVVKA